MGMRFARLKQRRWAWAFWLLTQKSSTERREAWAKKGSKTNFRTKSSGDFSVVIRAFDIRLRLFWKSAKPEKRRLSHLPPFDRVHNKCTFSLPDERCTNQNLIAGARVLWRGRPFTHPLFIVPNWNFEFRREQYWFGCVWMCVGGLFFSFSCSTANTDERLIFAYALNFD